MSYSNEQKIFTKGLEAFNNKKFYDAHEYWEELWLDYKLKDARFIQGLIQLSVSYFHLFNNNQKGACSMIKKCLEKFEGFEFARGIDVLDLVKQIKKTQIHINKISQISFFKSSYIININVIDE